MPKILLQPTPLYQQQLTSAIGDAYRRGDDAEVNALLVAKMALSRREAAADGWSLKGAA